MTSLFRDTGHFEASAPNDPKMTLNTIKSYVPHIYVTCSIHESQISFHFALRQAILEIQVILRQVHQMTSNWPWILQGQITLYMYNHCSRFSNFTPFRSITRHFRVTGHLGQVHRITPKWPWTLQGHRCTTYILLVSPSPKFHSVLLYGQPFSRYRTFYNCPLTTILNVLKEHNSLYSFGRNPSCEYAWTVGSKSVVHFQTRCSWSYFSHMVPC